MQHHNNTAVIKLAAPGVTPLDWGQLIELSAITNYSDSEVLHCLKFEDSNCCI